MRKIEIDLTGSKLVVMSVNDILARQALQIAVRQEAVSAKGEPLVNPFNDILTVTDSSVTLQRSVGNQAGGTNSQPITLKSEGKYSAFNGSEKAVVELVEEFVKENYV
jgi:hypothetical protein